MNLNSDFGHNMTKYDSVIVTDLFINVFGHNMPEDVFGRNMPEDDFGHNMTKDDSVIVTDLFKNVFGHNMPEDVFGRNMPEDHSFETHRPSFRSRHQKMT